jgi:guanosine-3',5'-bis(diphosphate) 3'-pyrophosphohydrolase
MEKLAKTPAPAELGLILSTVSFIATAHAGQLYGKMPYMFHPMEVAAKVEYASVDEYLAALLHDVIEDTEFTEAALRERFSDAVVDMVVLLTKDDTLDYRANIQRIIDSKNIGAMKVKLADNKVNLKGDKSDMSPERATKLNTRYEMSIAMLSQPLIAHRLKTQERDKGWRE